MSRDLDRARGALLGLAIGDALGTTNEFSRHPHRLSYIAGGGPYGVKRGQVTDDTHMAVCLAESLASVGRHDPSDVARRYVAWSKVTFDIGMRDHRGRVPGRSPLGQSVSPASSPVRRSLT